MKSTIQAEPSNATVPKLSIVVPCYNTAAYLPRCLDSLITQTTQEIEIICVNDGSPDNSLDILFQYAKANPGLIRIVDKENGGLWAARWTGTDVARGEYIAYVDSDDYVEPTFAEELITTVKEEQADIVVCGFKRINDESGEVISCELSDKRPSFNPKDQPGNLIAINPAAWNKAFSRTLLLAIQRLNQPPDILEDVVLSQLAYLSAKKAIAFTGTAPYNYLIRQGSMINSVTPQQVESVKIALLEVRRLYEAENAPQSLLQELDAVAFLHLGISMGFRLSCNTEVNLKNEIANTTKYLDEYFPTWRNSPYINRAFARNGSAYSKLLIAQRAYKLHLMKPFLAIYRFVIEKLPVDIKW